MRKALLFSVLVVLLFGSVSTATEYVFEKVQYANEPITELLTINDLGVAAGGTRSGVYEPTRGFIYGSGGFSDVIVPSATLGIFCQGINNLNQVVGSYHDGSGWKGYILDGDNFSTGFNHPQAEPSHTTFEGINDTGTIAGYFNDGSVYHGFSFEGNQYSQAFDFGSGISSTILDINNEGQMVGWSHNNWGDQKSYLLNSEGVIQTEISVPNADWTRAYGISNNGVVAGSYFLNGREFGFIFDSGSYESINLPFATSLVIRDINIDDTIVGYYVDRASSETYGFIAVVPEPATICLMGFGGIVLLRKRR